MERNRRGVCMEAHAQEIWQQIHNGLRAFIAKRVANEAEVMTSCRTSGSRCSEGSMG